MFANPRECNDGYLTVAYFHPHLPRRPFLRNFGAKRKNYIVLAAWINEKIWKGFIFSPKQVLYFLCNRSNLDRYLLRPIYKFSWHMRICFTETAIKSPCSYLFIRILFSYSRFDICNHFHELNIHLLWNFTKKKK